MICFLALAKDQFSRVTQRLHCLPCLTLVAPIPGLDHDRMLSRARQLPALSTSRMICLGVLIDFYRYIKIPRGSEAYRTQTKKLNDMFVPFKPHYQALFYITKATLLVKYAIALIVFLFQTRWFSVPGGEAGDIAGSSVSSPSALALSLHKPCT